MRRAILIILPAIVALAVISFVTRRDGLKVIKTYQDFDSPVYAELVEEGGEHFLRVGGKVFPMKPTANLRFAREPKELPALRIFHASDFPLVIEMNKDEGPERAWRLLDGEQIYPRP